MDSLEFYGAHAIKDFQRINFVYIYIYIYICGHGRSSVFGNHLFVNPTLVLGNP